MIRPWLGGGASSLDAPRPGVLYIYIHTEISKSNPHQPMAGYSANEANNRWHGCHTRGWKHEGVMQNTSMDKNKHSVDSAEEDWEKDREKGQERRDSLVRRRE